MPDPQVWFAIPTASAENCARTLPAWRERGYRIALFQDGEGFDASADRIVREQRYPGWGAAVNDLCRRAVPTSADVIVTGGDDMLPDPDRSAVEIAGEFLERFPDRFGVMQPEGAGYDLHRYCGSPWLGAAWARSMYRGTGPLFPGYRHNWADNELFWVARGMRALWRRPDLSQAHEHFSLRGEAPPPHWVNNAAGRDRADLQLLVARTWSMFPGHEPRGVDRAFDADLFRREYNAFAEIHLVDRYGFASLAPLAESRLRDALEDLARRGRRRVGLFGAGTHTRALAGALMNPPVEIDCLIDQSEALVGRRRWGFAVLSVEQAASRRLDAVVLSANCREAELRRACAPLERAGVEIVTLYAAGDADGAIAPGREERIAC